MCDRNSDPSTYGTFAETWCEKCAEPTSEIVATASGDKYLCKRHAADLRFMIGSRNFNGGTFAPYNNPKPTCPRCGKTLAEGPYAGTWSSCGDCFGGRS